MQLWHASHAQPACHDCMIALDVGAYEGLPVLVAGAGVSGAAAARVLRERGARVTVADTSFTPGHLKVAVGDTVTFENDGAIAHTATAAEGADFDSGSIAPGDTFTFTASKAGTVSYVCTFHPGMQGTIEVG